MSKIAFTPEMAETIRELRMRNKITAKEIASVLGKSTSYVSKIENGMIKSITDDDLNKILEIVLPECASFQERIEQLVSHQLKKSGLDAEDMIWFYNLDTVYRVIPIPSALISEIKELMVSLNLSSAQLVTRINSNEDLSDNLRENDELPYNEWIESDTSDSKMVIRMKLSQSEVDSVLDGTEEVCNYITMQAIVHYIFKCKLFPDKTKLSNSEIQEVQLSWLHLLDKHKFYTLSRKEKLLSQVRTKNQEKLILNDFDLENQESVNTVLKFFKMAADLDVVTANTSLRHFISNLEWDYNFTLRLIGLEFDSVGECSFTNKVEMLREIKGIIQKYRDLPPEKKTLDTYGDL